VVLLRKRLWRRIGFEFMDPVSAKGRVGRKTSRRREIGRRVENGLEIQRADPLMSAHSTMEEVVVESTTIVEANPAKKLKPARKQVKPGQIEKKESPQTGKEYSE
jgi:hypothetical protein